VAAHTTAPTKRILSICARAAPLLLLLLVVRQ
jgi:hypothetical protein